MEAKFESHPDKMASDRVTSAEVGMASVEDVIYADVVAGLPSLAVSDSFIPS